ncbi:ABC transporter permease [Leifsonia virtsii]|uniref:ABC transporter permease n=1 Tax=Leifsonia virtsii TaxID=3035915 RepID=A0ABT8IU77_9MICO|nr:ABC transporter permease [Leifsonia virtsii]MDN4595619.1 ABC transporter permease [Leifsonia virtsii]
MGERGRLMTDTVAGAAAPAAGRTAAGSSVTEPRRQPSSARPAGARAGRRRRGGVAAVLGLTPFAFYVVVFLAIPTVVAVGSGFVDGEGRFTWSNLSGLAEPAIAGSFFGAFWLSAVTAIVGAIAGAALCFAMLRSRPGGVTRSLVDSASSVLAQFGGVMLAFAFIATIGAQGLVTVLLRNLAHINIYENGVWLYTVPGLILPYLYFQIPLMVITFLPALEGLRPQWLEATATLGGSRWTYWTRVGGPILLPSFLGSLLLLFANAFSSYATAAALVGQANNIVSLQIRQALISETVLGRANLAGAMALGMLVVMVVVMLAYSALVRRTARWQR